jgi:hypothetical protein
LWEGRRWWLLGMMVVGLVVFVVFRPEWCLVCEDYK